MYLYPLDKRHPLRQYQLATIFCWMLFAGTLNAQDSSALKQDLLQLFFKSPNNGIQAKRAFINDTHHKHLSTKIAGGLIYFYQNIISEQLQADCTYQITCSEYIKQCIERYGFAHGTMAGLNQYMKCSANNFKNHEDHKIDDNKKILNNINDEAN